MPNISDKLSYCADPDQTAVISTPIWVCVVYCNITSEVFGYLVFEAITDTYCFAIMC